MANFAELHPDLDESFFGKWWQHIERKTKENQNTREKPLPDWFGVPKSNDHFNELMVDLMKTGMPFSLAEKEIQDKTNIKLLSITITISINSSQIRLVRSIQNGYQNCYSKFVSGP